MVDDADDDAEAEADAVVAATAAAAAAAAGDVDDCVEANTVGVLLLLLLLIMGTIVHIESVSAVERASDKTVELVFVVNSLEPLLTREKNQSNE